MMEEYVIILAPDKTIVVYADAFLVKSDANVVIFSVDDKNEAVFNMNNIVGFYCNRK